MKTAGTFLAALVLAFSIVLTSAGCAPAQGNTNAEPARNTNAQVDSSRNDQAALQDRQNQAEAEFKRLTDLRTALGEIPFDGDKKEPHAALIKKHEGDIVYNEPAGQYIVRSDKFWDLAEKYKDLAIADEIAWTAAENPLAGECEGYAPCALDWMRITNGRYLEMFPDGKHRDAALKNIADLLSDLEPEDETLGTWPTEADEKAAMHKSLEELAAIVSNANGQQKEAILADIEKLRNAVK